jgi:hypothetical protein
LSKKWVKMREIRADLHTHFGHTADRAREYGFDRIVEHASEKLGEGGILGIADFFGNYGTHFHYGEFAQLESDKYEKVDLGNGIYVPQKDLLVVRGEEIAVSHEGEECHLLVFGSDELGVPSVEVGTDVLAAVRGLDFNRVSVLDHPFFAHGALAKIGVTRVKTHNLLAEIDGIEVFNGMAALFPGANKKAEIVYVGKDEHYYTFGGIISSDAHSLEDMGSSYSILRTGMDYSGLERPSEVTWGLRKAIRSIGETSVGIPPEGKRTPLIRSASKHALEVIINRMLKGKIK